jgi:hypothetical protein
VAKASHLKKTIINISILSVAIILIIFGIITATEDLWQLETCRIDPVCYIDHTGRTGPKFLFQAACHPSRRNDGSFLGVSRLLDLDVGEVKKGLSFLPFDVGHCLLCLWKSIEAFSRKRSIQNLLL